MQLLTIFSTSKYCSIYQSLQSFHGFFFVPRFAVSESLLLLPALPLRDRPKRQHRAQHQEELPRHASVHDQVPPEWRPGCVGQPQDRVRHSRHLYHLNSFTCILGGFLSQTANKLEGHVRISSDASAQWAPPLVHAAKSCNSSFRCLCHRCGSLLSLAAGKKSELPPE